MRYHSLPSTESDLVALFEKWSSSRSLHLVASIPTILVLIGSMSRTSGGRTSRAVPLSAPDRMDSLLAGNMIALNGTAVNIPSQVVVESTDHSGPARRRV